jgi:hypothetical protein
LLSNFALGYAIKKVQENQVGLNWNGTHKLLAYADDVNLLEDDIDTIQKNKEILIDASKVVWSRNKCRENEVYVAVSSSVCRSKLGHKNSKQII